MYVIFFKSMSLSFKMGICETSRDQIYTGHRPVPMNFALKALKSICKITIKLVNNNNIYGTGFFMNIIDSKKYLITNNHVINQEIIDGDIIIEIYNHKIMKLKTINREIKYFKKPKDITIIEIKKNDDIYDDIDFLDYDSNSLSKGYKIYKNIDIFSIEHPLGDDAACASCQIIKIND